MTKQKINSKRVNFISKVLILKDVLVFFKLYIYINYIYIYTHTYIYVYIYIHPHIYKVSLFDFIYRKRISPKKGPFLP